MNLILRTLSITITSLFCTTSALSADWHLLERYEESSIYIDKDSIEPFKNSSVKLSYKLEKNDESGFMKGVTIMRCKNKTHTLQSLKFSKPSQNQSQTLHIEEDEQKTAPVAGFNLPLYEYVCKTK